MPRETKIIAIVQARMGSTRLPGKVLTDLGGATVLARVVERVRRSARVDQVVIATSVSPIDQPIVSECERLNVACFRGSEEDVLDRYFRAAQRFDGETVLRVTSDCPLTDPTLIDGLIQAFAEREVDFACNVAPRTYPRGLDAEVFTLRALAKAREMADMPHQREHVTTVFYERPDVFRMTSVRSERDYSRYRWTLDTNDDLRLIRQIYQSFGNRSDFTWRDVIALMERNPQLENINAHVVQKPVRTVSSSCA